jgi:hypothetical protein
VGTSTSHKAEGFYGLLHGLSYLQITVSTELVPLLRLLVLPPAIQHAIMHLSKLNGHGSSLLSLDGDTAAGTVQTAVVLPAKKRRGRPAKTPHKVDEGNIKRKTAVWRCVIIR